MRVARVEEDKKRGLVAYLDRAGDADEAAVARVLGEFTRPWAWAEPAKGRPESHVLAAPRQYRGAAGVSVTRTRCWSGPPDPGAAPIWRRWCTGWGSWQVRQRQHAGARP